MQFDWLTNRWPLYGAALAALAALVWLIRARLNRAPADSLRVVPLTAIPAPPSEVAGLRAEIEQLRESVYRLEEALPVRGTGQGMNLTKRMAALRMHRRGQSVPAIASALETPGNEIALLLKVHEMTKSGSEVLAS